MLSKSDMALGEGEGPRQNSIRKNLPKLRGVQNESGKRKIRKDEVKSKKKPT